MAKKKNLKKAAPVETLSRPMPGKKNKPVKPLLPSKTVLILIFTAVVLSGFIIYLPSLSNEFTNWDDPGYITENQDIRDWSVNGINHLFHSYTKGNYHPITMLSLAAEYHVAALKPYMYHLDSLLLHLLTCLSVTVFTWLLTRNLAITAFCGLLFTIHPMHVESVAWVSGRKDVLYALFYFLSLIGYYYYCTAKKNNILFYGLCLIMFLLSLLSKGIAVTLPLSCLLIDYYLKRPLKIRSLTEKIPMLILSIIFGIISIKAQQSSDSISTDQMVPIFNRIFFASYAFLAYIAKFILPADLCNFYPYPVKPNDQLTAIWYIYPIIIVSLLFVIYRFARKNKDVVFGFLFYASCIFLLIQLLPVGTAIIAERYSYISYFGLFFIAGSLYSNAMSGLPSLGKSAKPVISLIVLVWFIYLGINTNTRCGVWKDSETLWRDEIKKQPELSRAYANLGSFLFFQEKYDEALPELTKAIELGPPSAGPYSQLGNIYEKQGKYDLAAIEFKKALELNPKAPVDYNNLGFMLQQQGKLDEALPYFNKQIELNPNFGKSYTNRGELYRMEGKTELAFSDLNKAISLDSNSIRPYESRGILYMAQGKYDKAAADFDSAIKIDPKAPEAYNDRGYNKTISEIIMKRLLLIITRLLKYSPNLQMPI